MNRAREVARVLTWSIAILKYDGRSRPVYYVRKIGFGGETGP